MSIPCQIERRGPQKILHWLLPRLRAEETVQYELRIHKAPEPTPSVQFEHDRDQAQIHCAIQGKLFTTYHYGDAWARPFLYPVIGPHGLEVTRGWPVNDQIPGETTDHPHHKSIWVAHGECNTVDNWSEEPGHGVQRHQELRKLQSGPVFGQLQTKIHWRHPSGRKQFEEIRDIVVYDLPGGERLMDFTITFHMSEGSVTFRDTKEGGLLSVRVATPLDGDKGGQISNGYGGVSEAETWGKKAPWCDYSGEIDGHPLGIALLDHEDNPRYPTEWHVRDYGLMTANCFGWRHFRPHSNERGDMTFKKGARQSWRYRMFIHQGNAIRANIADRFFDFIAPPKPEISPGA